LNEATIVLIIWLIFITAIWTYISKKVYHTLKRPKKQKIPKQLYQELTDIQKAYEKTMATLVELFVPKDVIEASFEPLAQRIEEAVKKLDTEIEGKEKKQRK